MKQRLLLLILFCSSFAFSQPYLDVLTVQGNAFPTSAIAKGKDDVHMSNDWWLVNLNLPFELNKRNLILLSPGWEHRSYVFKDENKFVKTYETVYLPVTFLHTFSDTSKNISATGIYRFNKLRDLPFNNQSDMIGGAVLYSKTVSETFTWKAGAYYNREFFGNLFLPLAGFEWKATPKLYVWGLLPNNFVIDYRLQSNLHIGCNVNAIIESYKEVQPGSYTKFSEEQLYLFCDYYLKKIPLIISLQAGHTVGRNYSYRANENAAVTKYNPSESMIFHAGIAYRFVTNTKFITPQSKSGL